MYLLPKVSVCVPVYGVEKYIEQSVRTLFGQTLREIEYVFVDDCSPDKSIEIMQRVLEEFPERKAWVKLIRHETNQGVGAARNHAVAACTGEYVIHCDPDDWVELDMYEKMYNKAKETDADIVYTSSVIEYSVKEWIKRKIFRHNFVECFDMQEYYDKLLMSNVSCSLCDKMYRRYIAQHQSVICPKEIIVGEDFLRNLLMLKFCKKISFLCAYKYHYRTVRNSITHSKKKEIIVDKLKGKPKVLEIIRYKKLADEKFCNNFQAFALQIALRAKCSRGIYDSIFPDFQANVENVELNFEKKIVIRTARYNMLAARCLDCFFANAGKIKKYLWLLGRNVASSCLGKLKNKR